MKKNISILSIALLAGLFAAGCGKLEKCEGAAKDKCAKAENFKDGVKCAYQVEAADATKGKCMDLAAAETAFQTDCDAITTGADKDKCKAVAARYDGVTGKCEFNSNACKYAPAAKASADK